MYYQKLQNGLLQNKIWAEILLFLIYNDGLAVMHKKGSSDEGFGCSIDRWTQLIMIMLPFTIHAFAYVRFTSFVLQLIKTGMDLLTAL